MTTYFHRRSFHITFHSQSTGPQTERPQPDLVIRDKSKIDDPPSKKQGQNRDCQASRVPYTNQLSRTFSWPSGPSLHEDILLQFRNHGVWLSLVERCVRDAEVEGSNPFAPTQRNLGKPYLSRGFFVFGSHRCHPSSCHVLT